MSGPHRGGGHRTRPHHPPTHLCSWRRTCATRKRRSRRSSHSARSLWEVSPAATTCARGGRTGWVGGVVPAVAVAAERLCMWKRGCQTGTSAGPLSGPTSECRYTSTSPPPPHPPTPTPTHPCSPDRTAICTMHGTVATKSTRKVPCQMYCRATARPSAGAARAAGRVGAWAPRRRAAERCAATRSQPEHFSELASHMWGGGQQRPSQSSFPAATTACLLWPTGPA
jgi:hypothetical protein